MGWFWKRRRLEFDHPVFGWMARDRYGVWVGAVRFAPLSLQVQVRQPGPEEGPDDWGSTLYRDLLTRFAALETSLAAAMYGHYSSHGIPAGAPTPGDATEFGGLLQLDDVSLEGPVELSLGYGFAPGVGWDDATFTVVLRDWNIVTSL